MSKKILITGAGGFVGSYLIKELQKNADSQIFASIYQASSDISSSLPKEQILAGDLSDLAYANHLIQTSKPDIIYHLAALSVVGGSEDKALSLIQNNTAITGNLLQATKLHAPKTRFMAISSANIYGAVLKQSPLDESTPLRPLNPYAISKIAQEMQALQYHLAHNLDVVILRPFNHSGPGQTTKFVLPALASQFAQIEKGELPPQLTVGNLSTIRDFTDVRDMVKAYILASQVGGSGEIYNIGTGTGHSISSLIEVFSSLSPIKVEIKKEENLVRRSDVPYLVADASKFKSESMWMPSISLNQTISDILNYYRNK